MGRNRPVGIALAALLFGVLYQGGAELAFDVPKITREMVIVIIGPSFCSVARWTACCSQRSANVFTTVACAGAALMDETFC